MRQTPRLGRGEDDFLKWYTLRVINKESCPDIVLGVILRGSKIQPFSFYQAPVTCALSRMIYEGGFEKSFLLNINICMGANTAICLMNLIHVQIW